MRIEGGDPQLADAVARHRPALEAGEARHNLILGLFEHTKQLKPEEYRFWSFARPGSCAFHMGVRNIVLGELAAEDHEALAGSMDGLDWQGIVGPEESAAGLARRFEKRGRAFAPPLEGSGVMHGFSRQRAGSSVA